MVICDFCSSPNAPVTIECAPFIMLETKHMEHWSDNAWAACAQCAALIDANEWDRLIDRVVRLIGLPIDRELETSYRAYLKQLYEKFRVVKGQVA